MTRGFIYQQETLSTLQSLFCKSLYVLLAGYPCSQWRISVLNSKIKEKNTISEIKL